MKTGGRISAWILIERCTDDDTMIVICHWHREPTKEEIEEMIEIIDPRPYPTEYFIAKA